MVSVRIDQLYIKQTWLTTQMMKKDFISDLLTPLSKKGTGITIEILNKRSMKTVQNWQNTSGC